MAKKQKKYFEEIGLLLHEAAKRNAGLSLHQGVEWLGQATKSELYIIDVALYYYSVKEKIEELKQNSKFLQVTEVPKELKKQKVTEEHYYKFIFENNLIRISTIIDLILHFINKAYRLGLKDHDVTENQIISNTNFSESQTAPLLKKLLIDFKNLKSDRNKIIHKGEYSNKDLEDLLGYFSLREILTDEEIAIVFLNKEKKQSHNKLLKIVDLQIDKLLEHFYVIGESCTEIIKYHYQALKLL